MEIRQQEHNKTSIYIRVPWHSMISMLLYCILISFPKLACSQSLNIDSVSAFFNISIQNGCNYFFKYEILKVQSVIFKVLLWEKMLYSNIYIDYCVITPSRNLIQYYQPEWLISSKYIWVGLWKLPCCPTVLNKVSEMDVVFLPNLVICVE